jgi:hypothetical protein
MWIFPGDFDSKVLSGVQDSEFKDSQVILIDRYI